MRYVSFLESSRTQGLPDVTLLLKMVRQNLYVTLTLYVKTKFGDFKIVDEQDVAFKKTRLTM